MKALFSSERILAGIAILAPLVAVYAPLGLAALLGLAAVLAIVGRFWDRQSRIAPDRVTMGLLAGLVALSAVSAAWSIDVSITHGKFERFLLAIAAGGILIGLAQNLDPNARNRIGPWILAGAIGGFAALAIERATGGLFSPITYISGESQHFFNQFNRGLTFLAILSWPAIGFAAERRPIYGVALGLTQFAILFAFSTTAAILGMTLGAAAYALVWLAPRTGSLLVAASIAASIVVCPVVVHSLPPAKEILEAKVLPRSSYHRLLIWKFSADRIFEKPVLGWGFNSSRVIPGGKTQLDTFEAALPLHPHNGALQLWLELGVVGALFGAAIVLRAGNALRQETLGRVSRASAAAAIVSAYAIILVSYGIWQSWWMSNLFIAAALATAACGRTPERTPA